MRIHEIIVESELDESNLPKSITRSDAERLLKQAGFVIDRSDKIGRAHV